MAGKRRRMGNDLRNARGCQKIERSRSAAGHGYGVNSHALWQNSKLEIRDAAVMIKQKTARPPQPTDCSSTAQAPQSKESGSSTRCRGTPMYFPRAGMKPGRLINEREIDGIILP